MNIDLIKKFFNGFKKITKTSLDRFKSLHELEYNALVAFLQEHLEWVSIECLVTGILKNMKLKNCIICGKTLTYYQTKNNCECCSIECKRKNKEIIKKMKQTCIERYGVDNPAKSDEIKRKTEEKCLKEHGCRHNFQRDDVKQKMQETFFNKYGVKFIGQHKGTRDKIHTTNLEKYGFENAIQSKTVQEKIKKTNNERYGSDYPLQNKDILNETIKNGKKTNLKKTGFENANTIKGWNTILSWKDYVIPMFSKEEYKGTKNRNVEYEWKCVKCGNVFKQRIYASTPKPLASEFRKLPRCLKCYPLTNGFSYSELELLDFVHSFFPNAHKDKALIKPYELDIVIDELKLAIEFNGKYYHSINEAVGVPKGYHLMKTKMCNEKGYRLIHIWENDWSNHKDELKHKLTDVLTGNEILNFNDIVIKLDRSWYNNIEIKGYALLDETPPEIVVMQNYNIENCGYLIYKKI